MDSLSVEKKLIQNFAELFDFPKDDFWGMVTTGGTEFKGAIDDIGVLNKIIAKKNVKYVYRHVDAALFGGYLIFTGLSYLVSQQKQGYDSIAISGHKWFGIDEPCGLVLCTNKVFTIQKSDSIPYLAADMPMISCSRCAQSPMKLYWLLHTRGKYGYARDANFYLTLT